MPKGLNLFRPFLQSPSGLKTLVSGGTKAYSMNMIKYSILFVHYAKNAFIRCAKRNVKKQTATALSERTIGLNQEEAAFIERQTCQLLRWQKAENVRRHRLGIPPPPVPGKIAYAVYM